MASSIKLRTDLEAGTAGIRILIRHPMETGAREDPRSGEPIPAHYIRELTCEHQGRTVLTAHWGTGIARNPYLAFRFKGAKAGDSLRIRWVDNLGDEDSLSVTL